MTDNVFKYLSYLGCIFIMWGCVIALPELYYRSENLISNTGMGIFFAGIGMSLNTLTPKKDFSKNEIKIFSSKKRIHFEYAQHIFWFGFTMSMGAFLFSLKLINPSAPVDTLSQFRDVGCGAFSMSVGFICELKSKRDRYQQFKETQSKQEAIA